MLRSCLYTAAWRLRQVGSTEPRRPPHAAAAAASDVCVAAAAAVGLSLQQHLHVNNQAQPHRIFLTAEAVAAAAAAAAPPRSACMPCCSLGSLGFLRLRGFGNPPIQPPAWPQLQRGCCCGVCTPGLQQPQQQVKRRGVGELCGFECRVVCVAARLSSLRQRTGVCAAAVVLLMHLLLLLLLLFRGPRKGEEAGGGEEGEEGPGSQQGPQETRQDEHRQGTIHHPLLPVGVVWGVQTPHVSGFPISLTVSGVCRCLCLWLCLQQQQWGVSCVRCVCTAHGL